MSINLPAIRYSSKIAEVNYILQVNHNALKDKRNHGKYQVSKITRPGRIKYITSILYYARLLNTINNFNH